jgi:hypothetical protein
LRELVGSSRRAACGTDPHGTYGADRVDAAAAAYLTGTTSVKNDGGGALAEYPAPQI